MFSAEVGNDGSAIAQAIDAATSPLLLGIDWSKNLEICDLINGTPDGEKSAVKMLRRQLRSENGKTTKLALELTDAAIKNCSARLHFVVATKGFLGDVVALAEGKKSGMWEARGEALKFIQEWGLGFKEKREHLPLFYETYISLKTKGAAFPQAEQSAPVFTPPPAGIDAIYDADDSAAAPPPSHSSEAAGGGRSGGGDAGGVVSAQEEADTAEMLKLKDDLRALSEKIKLCREMLPESPGIEYDETLAEIIGFLEACQPRMVDLVEAGMQGMLDEEVLGTALQVNDDLHKTLEAERNGTPLPVEPAKEETNSPTAAGGGGGGGDLLDLGGGGGSAAAVSPGGDEDEVTLGRRKKGRGRGGAGHAGGGAAAQDLFGLIAEPPRSAAPAPLAPPPSRFGARFEETPSAAASSAAAQPLDVFSGSQAPPLAATATTAPPPPTTADPFASMLPNPIPVTTTISPAAPAVVAPATTSAAVPADPFADAPTSLEAAGFSSPRPTGSAVDATSLGGEAAPSYIAPSSAAVLAEQQQQQPAMVVVTPTVLESPPAYVAPPAETVVSDTGSTSHDPFANLG